MQDVTPVTLTRETTRQFSTKVKEHLLTDKNSYMHKHLRHFPRCKKKCSAESFKFLTQPKLLTALNIGSIIAWPLALGSYVMNSSQIFSRTALPIGQ